MLKREGNFPLFFYFVHIKTMISKAKKLDQFYTSPKIAKTCLDWLYEKVPGVKRGLFIEPSAGTGNFSNLLKNVKAFDIHPKSEGILKKDFLKTSKKNLDTNPSKTCVIGNPPFGKNSSLAIKFFNHASLFADTIAFIVPRTFKKESVHQKLNNQFWLVFSKDLPKNSFIFQDSAYDVPCCFQIWIKKDKVRRKKSIESSNLFDFVKKDQADIAVRRVGGRTGKAILDPSLCSESSHYFLKIKEPNLSKNRLFDLINSLDFQKEANSTAGVRSISKQEFLKKVKTLSNI